MQFAFRPPAVLWPLFAALPLLAQPSVPGPFAGAGYMPPQPVTAAPGQVLTLYLRAGTVRLAEPLEPTQLPLPASLAGFSVSLVQSAAPEPHPAPLFTVFPLENCYGLAPSVCQPLLAITLQIPWSLRANAPGLARPENFALLRVSYNGQETETVPLDPVTDAIHVLRTCDLTVPAVARRPPERTGPCRPLVTHLDGQLVTPAHPAQPGETLVVYAAGLGLPASAQSSGQPALAPAAVEGVQASYAFGPDLPASAPRQAPAGQQLPLSYAGLTPGQVGLYQISFSVPPLPSGLRPCSASSLSNLTVSIARTASLAAAAFCVATPN